MVLLRFCNPLITVRACERAPKFSASLIQLVEYRTFNPTVVGSRPTGRNTNRRMAERFMARPWKGRVGAHTIRRQFETDIFRQITSPGEKVATAVSYAADESQFSVRFRG